MAGVPTEGADRGSRQLVGGLAGGIQLTDQGQHVLAHGLFDQGRLVGLLSAEAGMQLPGPAVQVALAAGAAQQRAQPGDAQPLGQGRGRRGGQQGARLWVGQAHVLDAEGLDRGGEAPPEHQAQLVGKLVTLPDRVLLDAGQHRDRLDQFGVGRQRPVGVGVGAQDAGEHDRVSCWSDLALLIVCRSR